MIFILENPCGKNQPTIDMLLSLAKPNQANQPPGPNQVSLHRSTLDTLQWSINTKGHQYHVPRTTTFDLTTLTLSPSQVYPNISHFKLDFGFPMTKSSQISCWTHLPHLEGG
jgi:hypothetical protein